MTHRGIHHCALHKRKIVRVWNDGENTNNEGDANDSSVLTLNTLQNEYEIFVSWNMDVGQVESVGS